MSFQVLPNSSQIRIPQNMHFENNYMKISPPCHRVCWDCKVQTLQYSSLRQTNLDMTNVLVSVGFHKGKLDKYIYQAVCMCIDIVLKETNLFLAPKICKRCFFPKNYFLLGMLPWHPSHRWALHTDTQYYHQHSNCHVIVFLQTTRGI